MLPMTVDQLMNQLTDTPLSGASPLPQLSRLHPADFGRMGGSQKSRVGSRHGLTHLGLNVGGGLLPIAVCQLTDSLADPPSSGASPLPQLSRVHPADFSRMVGCQKLLVGSRHELTHLGLNVGGGLLPMTVDQLMNQLTDTPLSGASPLPQLSCLHPADFGRMGGSQKSRVGSRHGLTRLGLNVGGGLLPIAVCQPTDSLADPPPSGASPLPQLSCLHPADFGRIGGCQKSRG
ncbi:putative membrane protein [Pseudomonas sp. 8 R 14]|nr:putative membrane protein [Pseudomonas sp. 8 R 14]